jgi:serine/threonine protein kinase
MVYGNWENRTNCPYRVEGVLGRGLRATVYLATREEESWTQQVAIKLMARGVNTDDVLRRFFSERQILTELRYPGICTLLDGGLTDDGLPYFVMEYIEGESIIEFCRNRKLGLADRIRLFNDVCVAVGQAHRHLIVHRDIKPANILVMGEGQVKLLDFGIAKMLEPEIAGSAAVTHMEARPMTPAYASPEQLIGEAITTATDIYQLGLLLAEMLTGVESPLKALEIEGGSRPARELSRAVGIEGAELPYPKKALRGDLEWIVLRCLEPDPNGRYQSVEELRADISHYLEDRPVLARRATFPYLVGKFARRRPGLAWLVSVRRPSNPPPVQRKLKNCWFDSCPRQIPIVVRGRTPGSVSCWLSLNRSLSRKLGTGRNCRLNFSAPWPMSTAD